MPDLPPPEELAAGLCERARVGQGEVVQEGALDSELCGCICQVVAAMFECPSVHLTWTAEPEWRRAIVVLWMSQSSGATYGYPGQAVAWLSMPT